jgi:hypothetical protein
MMFYFCELDIIHFVICTYLIGVSGQRCGVGIFDADKSVFDAAAAKSRESFCVRNNPI